MQVRLQVISLAESPLAARVRPLVRGAFARESTVLIDPKITVVIFVRPVAVPTRHDLVGVAVVPILLPRVAFAAAVVLPCSPISDARGSSGMLDRNEWE